VNDSNMPRVGCGAAIIRDGKIVLVKRRRNPEADHWGLPGGKVDPFETVPAAVAREIREELGLIIAPRQVLCVVDQIDRAQKQHWVAPVYLVENCQGDPVVREPDALAAVKWFALDDLPEPLTQATLQALRALRTR
jgi:mutator protein MutT